MIIDISQLHEFRSYGSFLAVVGLDDISGDRILDPLMRVGPFSNDVKVSSWDFGLPVPDCCTDETIVLAKKTFPWFMIEIRCHPNQWSHMYLKNEFFSKIVMLSLLRFKLFQGLLTSFISEVYFVEIVVWFS